MKKSILLVFLFCTACFIFHTSAQAAVTTSLVANRSAGVAPLSVHFNASQSSSTLTLNPFHDLHFEWNFGDDNGSAWRTGQSRNIDFGPVAGHVFETPGTYVVTLTITDMDGTTAIDSVSIAVSDPNTVFAANTICIALDNDNWSGAPSGSTQIVVPNNDTLLGTIAGRIVSGARRILLRRGDAWDTTETLNLVNFQGPGIFGAFGSGEKPVIHDTHLTGNYLFILDGGDLDFSGGEVFDWRIMDLMLWADSDSEGPFHTAFGSYYGEAYEPSQPFIYNVDVYNFHTGISIETDEASVVNCQVVRIVGLPGGNGSWIDSEKLVFMGNLYDGALTEPRAGEHLLRVPHTDDAVLSHNVMMRASRHAMKIHAQRGTPPTVDDYSKRIVLSDNRFYGGLGAMSAWTVAIAPQAGVYDERFQNVIVERNYFEESALNQIHLYISSVEGLTIRNNIFNSTLNGSNAMFVARRDTTVSWPSANVHIHNNTGITSNIWSFAVLDAAGYIENVELFNNLFVPESGSPQLVSIMFDGTPPDYTESDNLLTSTPDFVFPTPSPFALPLADGAAASLSEFNLYINTSMDWRNQSNCFKLTEESNASDVGLSLQSVRNDFEGRSRPQGSGYDIGAFEYVSGEVVDPPEPPVVPNPDDTDSGNGSGSDSGGGCFISLMRMCVKATPLIY